jgi:hypothetical protein
MGLVADGEMQSARRGLDRRLTTQFGGMPIVAIGVILAALRCPPATPR